jgi:extracellular factor (EF) 3-hydroxypalmitic acid methyl ester biosynthesis protein
MKHYEELTGGEGRRIFYRAERFDAKTLMSSISPVVDVQDESFDLLDVSMSGLSFVTPQSSVWLDELNKDIPLSLKLDATEIFAGSGKIRRIEPLKSKQIVALEFTKGYLDIKKILRRHDEIALQKSIHVGMNNTSDLVPNEYKQLISDAIFLLRSARSTLENIESELSAEMPRREERIRDTVVACESIAFERWKKIFRQGNKVISEIRHDLKTVSAVKRYTEATLTPELMAGKLFHRSYKKPLGYPGDFQVMNYFYNISLLGDTAYEKFCHKLGYSSGEVISFRMTMVRQAIARLASQAAEKGKESFDVASLGCGPAQEVRNFLKADTLPLQMNFTLIDQDHEALTYAYESAFPEVARLNGQVRVNCLHTSFVQFLAAGKLVGKLGMQDLVYSVGLVDYLSARQANRFVTGLYDKLKPGGSIIIGNMRHSEDSLEWLLDYVTDWKLEYRTEEEMLAMADKIELAAKREIMVDTTGHCYLLLVTKPE